MDARGDGDGGEEEMRGTERQRRHTASNMDGASLACTECVRRASVISVYERVCVSMRRRVVLMLLPARM